ncbi:MAG: hypothetical protein ACOCVQ_01615, partial [Bacillota bacterium]
MTKDVYRMCTARYRPIEMGIQLKKGRYTLSVIRTVLGDIDPGDLGFCQTHEHTWCDFRLAERDYLNGTVVQDPTNTMIFDDKERMIEELKAYYEMGGRALVDVTTNHWRLDSETLKELSEESGVKIVITGGFYIEPTLPKWLDDLSLDEVTEKMVAEVEEGDENGVKCGLYKSGIL